MSYLKSFIIGSSLPVFLHFFLSVQRLDDTIKNYSYQDYTILAPMYLGIMNMLSLYVARRFKLSMRQRYVVISLLSATIVTSIARLSHSYNFSDKKWLQYTVRIFLTHFFTFNVIIYSLETSLG